MSENKISSQGLTQGALMAAISAILSLMGYFLPLGTVLMILAAVPISVLCVKQKLTTALLSAIVATMLLSMFNIRFGINYALLCLPLGLVAGFFLKKRKKSSTLLIASSAIATVAIVAILLVGLLLGGIAPDQLMQSLDTMIEEIKAETIAMAEESGIFEAYQEQGMNKAETIALMNGMYDLMFMLAPACVVLVAVCFALIHFCACSAILKRMNYKVRKLPRFERWALPQWHIFVIIGLWIVLLVGGEVLPAMLMTLVKNLVIIYVCILTVVGIAVLAHKFHFRKQNSFTKMMIAFTIFFAVTSGIILLAALVGLFDMILDIRKLAQEKEEARLRYEEKKAMEKQREEALVQLKENRDSDEEDEEMSQDEDFDQKG